MEGEREGPAPDNLVSFLAFLKRCRRHTGGKIPLSHRHQIDIRSRAVINSGCALSRLRFANSGCALSRLRFADRRYNLGYVTVGALYERPWFVFVQSPLTGGVHALDLFPHDFDRIDGFEFIHARSRGLLRRFFFGGGGGGKFRKAPPLPHLPPLFVFSYCRGGAPRTNYL